MNLFISDTHFYHGNIIKYCSRPFGDVEQMNNAMISNWNSVVSRDDKIYHLGDFSLSYNRAKEILPLLNGYKILIKGNHDNPLPDMIKAGFDEAYHELKMKIGVKTVTLKHRPSPLSGYDAGKWQITGHVHNKSPLVDYDTKIINVSVENINYTPIKESELMKIINTRG